MPEGHDVIWLTDASELEESKCPATEKLGAVLDEAAEKRESDEFIKKTRKIVAGISKEASGTWTRAEEVIEFAKRMGYKKIGIGFCAGLKEEAAVLRDILKDHGFEVRGVACVVDGPCNSVGQAMLLNEMKTDLNILMGLCVGHDATFIKFSDAPVTPLAVKDKVTCHNPVAALYCNYQRKKLMAE